MTKTTKDALDDQQVLIRAQVIYFTVRVELALSLPITPVHTLFAKQVFEEGTTTTISKGIEPIDKDEKNVEISVHVYQLDTAKAGRDSPTLAQKNLGDCILDHIGLSTGFYAPEGAGVSETSFLTAVDIRMFFMLVVGIYVE